MTTYYDQEIEQLHQKLARIYHLGRLSPTEQIAAEGLWSRIERLETTNTLITVKNQGATS